MILVVGATGMVGGEICRRLATRPESVRALVRPTSDPGKVAVLRDLGLEVVVGDLRDRSSLIKACAGVQTVIDTVSSMPFAFKPGENDIATTDTRGALDLVDTAKASGVRRFVYLSFSKNLDLDFPLRTAKLTVEAHIRNSGLEYTVLRPSCFMEAWLGPMVGFDAANASATIYGKGEAPISWIAVRDVAEFAVRSLDVEAARNATVELGGPAALDPLEVVAIFEAVGRRPFTVNHVPVEAIEGQRDAATDDMGRSFATLMLCYAKGDRIPMEETARTFGMQLETVHQYAEATFASLPRTVA